MLQITIDVSSLTADQRSYIAQFITDYPSRKDLPSDETVGTVQPFSFPDIEEDAPSPEASFGPTLVSLPPLASPTGGVLLDKEGLPWDERIHSGNKAFVTDGTWRKRRGVDDVVVAQVETELRQIMSIPAAPVVPPPPPVTVVVPPPPPSPAVAVVTTDLPSTIPIVSIAAPAIPAAPVASEPNAYLNLIQLVTDVVTKKKLTRAQVDECITSVDVSLNLQLLSKRPDLIPQIAETIRTLAA